MMKNYKFNYNLFNNIYINSEIQLPNFENLKVNNYKPSKKINRIIIKFDKFTNNKKLDKIGHNIYTYNKSIHIKIKILVFDLWISLSHLEKKITYISINKSYYNFSRIFFNNGLLNSISVDKVLFDIIKYKLILSNILPFHSAMSSINNFISIYLGLAGSGKSTIISKFNTLKKYPIINDDLMFISNQNIFFSNNFITLRKYKFMGFFDYLIPNKFSMKKILLIDHLKSISMNKKFIFFEIKNEKINNLNVNKKIIKNKIKIIINKNLNIFNNRLLYSYLFVHPNTNDSIEKKINTLIDKMLNRSIR